MHVILYIQQQLSRIWRFLGTAISFALFGLGSLLLGLLVFPLLWLVIRKPEQQRRVARGLVTGALWVFVEIMRILGVLRYHITGLERSKNICGCLIVANHPSLIDVVFLLSIFRRVDCVVKSTLWDSPVTAATMRALDYIPNNDPEIVMEACINRLRNGHNLILFPEGTRTTPNQTPNFRRGAAVIATRARAQCLPVKIRCSPTTLTKAEPWYHIPSRQVLFEMEILDALPVQPFVDAADNERKASIALNQVLNQMLTP